MHYDNLYCIVLLILLIHFLLYFVLLVHLILCFVHAYSLYFILILLIDTFVLLA
jgi:hypothetical protein